MVQRKADKKTGNTAVADAFLQHESFLKRFLRRFLSRPQDIDDVAQEAFLKAFNAERKGEVRSPKSFLFQIAKNIALKELTQKSKLITDYIEELSQIDTVDGAKSIEDTVAGQQRFEVFCQAAASLPEQCRRSFLLRKVYGLSHREIAEHLGIAVSTVEKHQAAGLKRCSEFMRRRGLHYRDTDSEAASMSLDSDRPEEARTWKK